MDASQRATERDRNHESVCGRDCTTDRHHPFALDMSYFLPHLPSGWHVDEAIKSEEDRVVVIRFGHDWDSQCMTMDETLYGVAEKVQNFAVIYLCDITKVPDFNKVSITPCVLDASTH